MVLRPRHLLAPIFVAACGFSLYSIQAEVRQRTVETAQSELLLHARQAAHGLEGLFTGYEQMLAYLGSLPPVVRADPEGRALLAAFLARSPDVTAVTRVDADGCIVYTVPENPAAVGADISSQAHVRTLLATHRTVLSDVFQAVQGYRTVALHVPVFSGEVFRGSLAVLMPFDELARRYLAELRVGATGHAWLVSAAGTELYCADPTHIGTGAAAHDGDPSQASLLAAMMAGRAGTASLLGSSHLGSGTERRRFLVAYAPARVGDTTWSVAVAAAEDEVLEATQAFRDRWGAVVALLGAGLLLYAVGSVRTRAALRQARERERAAAALRGSHATMRTILESIDAEVYVADLETHEILFMNRRMQERFGGDLTGKLCWREFRQGDGPCPHCTNPQLVDAGGELNGVVTWEGHNPLTGRWYLNCDRAIRWVDGRTVRLQVATDITERRAAQEGRLRADKLESLGVLAGGIAHDFNNLLMGIMGNLSLARLRTSADPELQDLLGEAEGASVRAADLTQQLLTFAKGGAPVKRLASVGEILRESASFVLRGSKSRVELEVPEDLWAAEIDPGQIGQVVHNLVLNADQAMPDGGTVWISARNVVLDRVDDELAAGHYLEVTVRDQGTGIAPEHLPRISDPYFTTKGQGNGLGLATCHSIVRRHGGRIQVTSTGSTGTVFTFQLPATPVVAAPSPPRPTSLPAGQGRILVMDDEELIRDVAEAMLGAVGYEASTVADGVEAVALYRREYAAGRPFAAVIVDLTVPGGMGGEEALGQLREFDPAALVVVSSGYAADPILAEYAQRGFAGVLTKPYTLKELVRVLGEVLGGQGAAC